MVFYAVAHGRQIGVFQSVEQMERSVKGFSHFKCKKYKSKKQAKHFIKKHKYKQDKKNLIRLKKAKQFNQEKQIQFIYTDGSCIHHGTPNVMSGIGVYYGENDKRNCSMKIKYTDNNEAELKAVEYALTDVKKKQKKQKKHHTNSFQHVIVTDSQFVIQRLTVLGDKYHLNGWTANIKNKTFIQHVYYLFKSCKHVSLQFVKSHSNTKRKHAIGNACAHQLAQQGAKQNLSK